MCDSLTFAQLLSDLVESTKDDLPENYFTIKDFAAEVGRSYHAARRILFERVAEGELLTAKKYVNGYHTHIFWFPEVQNDKEG